MSELPLSPAKPAWPLVDAANLAVLMAWAPSYQRKFSEAAAASPLDGWQHQFAKSAAHPALAELLVLPGGRAAVDRLCARAGIRSVGEAISRQAKAALAAAGVGSRMPRRDWAATLAEDGAFYAAAWLLWEDGDAAATDKLATRYPDLAKLINGGPALAIEPTAQVAEPASADEVLASLRTALMGAESDDRQLPTLLRQAADRLDRLHFAAGEAASDRRTSLREALAAAAADIGAIGAGVGDRAAAALAALDDDWANIDTADGEAILAEAEHYRRVALAWKEALDALPQSHDYQRVATLHEDELGAWGKLAALLPASAEQADKPARGDEPRVPADALWSTPEAPAAADEGEQEMSPPVAVIEPKGAIEPELDATVTPVDEPTVWEPAPVPPAVWDEAPAGPIGAADERALIATPVDPRAERLADDATRALTAAMSQQRYGLAAHVSRVAEAGGMLPPFDFPSALLDALVAGLAVGKPRSDDAGGVFVLQRPAIVGMLIGSDDPATHLVAFAAALRPALFAIETGAKEVIDGATLLPTLGAGLRKLAVVASAARAGELIPGALAELGDRMTPTRQLDQMRDDLRRFLEDAQRRKIKFQRATAIWRGVLQHGSAHDALRAVIDQTPDAAALVEVALADGLADIDRLITEADRAEVAGRKAQALTAGARQTLADYLADLRERLTDWRAQHELVIRRPGNQYELRTRKELRDAAQAADKDLLQVEQTAPPSLRQAAVAARAAVASVLALFEGPETVRRSLGMRRNDDLLLLPRVWRPERAASWTADERNAFFTDVVELPEDAADFAAAFDRALNAGHFGQAARARDRVLIDDPAQREALDNRLVGERDLRTEAARRQLGRVRKRLNDLLGADDRQVLSRDLEPDLDKLDAMLVDVGDPQLDFADWQVRLDRIDGDLDLAFHTLLGPLLERVDRLEEAGQAVAELRMMVTQKDLTTLAEHIDAYEQGAAPPTPPAGLMETFSDQMLVGTRLDLPGLLQAIARRETRPDVDFAAFEEGQIETAAALLKAWRVLLTHSGRDAAAVLGTLFQELLSSAVKVTVARGAIAHHYELRTPTYASREECVVPAFGSAAEGRYDILLIDARTTASWVDIANLKAQCSAPTFFVVRGAMPASARHAFMRQVRVKGANPACALIDEALLLFLATRPARQRADLFALAMAMGVVQPYSDAAQQTSPEMFFGRVEELRELWDPNGSCLVYGGRQLGKTALLLQIELRHDRPDQIVVYGDDDREKFSDGRSITFWRWVARKLRERGVAAAGGAAQTNSDSVQRDVQAWLAADSTRRLLFLIDEADVFLRREIHTGFANGKPSILVEVRELMRVTNRRCKFVFAGLHDVQRLARTPNSPLLHFGRPIRVGPLMGKDLFEARGMVEQPMAAAGYAFGRSAEEGRALVGRALSEVGYYPSLLQTFGMVLVNRLNARAATRLANPPTLPIRIGEAELDEALADNAFRENVSIKFDKTLNLDPRYRLIAYVVLLGTQDSADREEMRPGMSTAQIQKDALFWWPQGFAEDATNSAFEGLLQEMEGLGVLVSLNDGRYAIRSARIAAMLGTLKQVEDRLVELAGEPYAVADDTGSNRRLIGTAPSPLTFREEAVVLERKGAAPVAVVLSSQALGLDVVAMAIDEVREEQLYTLAQRVINVRELERAIATVAARMKPGGCGLLIAHGPWLGSDAILSALNHAEVRRARRNSNQGVRVLLLPTIIDWQELDVLDEGSPLWGATAVTLSTLQAVGLRDWVARRTGNQAPPAAMIDRLRAATGGFPALLSNLTGRTIDDLVANAEQAADLLAADPGGALPRFGLEDKRLLAITRVIGVGSFDANARDTLVDLLATEGVRAPERGLDVLGMLGLLEHVADVKALSNWRLNPLIARLITGLDS